jgi:hypothetical protein
VTIGVKEQMDFVKEADKAQAIRFYGLADRRGLTTFTISVIEPTKNVVWCARIPLFSKSD